MSAITTSAGATARAAAVISPPLMRAMASPPAATKVSNPAPRSSAPRRRARPGSSWVGSAMLHRWRRAMADAAVTERWTRETALQSVALRTWTSSIHDETAGSVVREDRLELCHVLVEVADDHPVRD